jgi:hypothetical protein
MPLNRRVPLLLSITLLLSVSGIFTRTAGAQVNEFKGEEACNLYSQAPHEAHGASLLNYFEVGWTGDHLGGNVKPEGNPDLDVPRFDQNTRSIGSPCFRLVNLDERVDPTVDCSTQVLPPRPQSTAAPQVVYAMLVDTDSLGAPSAAPPLPDPPKSSNEGWHFGIAPYLWFAGAHGTVGALGHEGSVHASFRDIFSHFNIGLMFALEPRYNRIVMPFDFMWMKLSDDKALPFEVGPTSVKAKINEIMLTQKVGAAPRC